MSDTRIPRPGDYEHPNHLRAVELDGHGERVWILETWEAGGQDYRGVPTVGYRLRPKEGKALFEAEDYHPSPFHAIDSDEALRGLISFLTLQPGDTDPEYFEKYTPEQEEFADGLDVMNLALYADEDAVIRFRNIDGRNDDA